VVVVVVVVVVVTTVGPTSAAVVPVERLDAEVSVVVDVDEVDGVVCEDRVLFEEAVLGELELVCVVLGV